MEGGTGSVLDAEMLAPNTSLDDVLALYGAKPPDFPRFWLEIAAVTLFVRFQVVFQLATDAVFSQRVFKSFSATDRLRRIAAVLTAESLEVS